MDLHDGATSTLHELRDRALRLRADEAGVECSGVLTPEEVAAFESQHGISLPEEYQLFLTCIGNGCMLDSMPVAILPLGQFQPDYSDDPTVKPYLLGESWKSGEFANLPFPLTETISIGIFPPDEDAESEDGEDGESWEEDMEYFDQDWDSAIEQARCGTLFLGKRE